jgi:MscS family membrane protein
MDKFIEGLKQLEVSKIIWTMLRYGGAFVVLAAFFYISKLISYVSEKHLKKLVQRTRFHLDDVIVEASHKPLSLGAIAIGIYIAVAIMNIEVSAQKYFGVAAAVLALVFLLRFINGLTEYLKPYVHSTKTSLDDAVLPAMRTAVKVFVVIVVALWVLTTLGYEISSILAGLGIGGLAVALAAQSTLSNWFGAFMIFTDRPFVAGQIVTIGDVTGLVEQVGLRSTSIRTFDGTLVAIPNSLVANTKIENVSRMPGRRYAGAIGVTYDTPVEKVEEGLNIIRTILAGNPHVQEGFVVRFDDFGPHSLDFRVVYVTDVVDYKEYMAVKEGINLSILKKFNEAGIEFAFPTQTIYVKGS